MVRIKKYGVEIPKKVGRSTIKESKKP